MKLTLKVKFYALIMSLALLFTVIVIITIFNFLTLSNDIDGLMNSNSRSLDAAYHLDDITYAQYNMIFNYIYHKSSDSIKNFDELANDFNKWLNIENNNITETNEKETVIMLVKNYSNFINNVSEAKKQNFKTEEERFAFFNKNIRNLYTEIRNNINEITIMNEKAILRSKQIVADKAQGTSYLIIIITVLFLASGSAIAMFIINSILKPIYSLRQSVSRVSSGELDIQAPIISNDETGELTKEFNLMTEKLYEFEKNTLNEIETEKHRSLTIVESIPEPIVLIDMDMKIELVNKAFESLFNITEESAKGKELFEFLSKIDVYGFVFLFMKGEKETDNKLVKIEKSSESEESLYYNILASKVKDVHSNLKGIVLAFNNITDIKKLEKMKSSVISAFSHDFKTPLTSILMGISILESKAIGEINEKQKEIIYTIKEDSEKILDMIQNLLQVKEFESKENIFDFKAVDIKIIIEESTKYFQKQIEIENKKFEINIDTKLPPVYGDEEKITLVINNLISNAIKFTLAGDYIFVKAYEKNELIYVEVEDSGIGIPEEETERIFEKYYQIPVQGNEIKPDGTGLGLALSREIIDEHGGKIWAESKKGKWTRFTFTLKLYNE